MISKKLVCTKQLKIIVFFSESKIIVLLLITTLLKFVIVDFLYLLTFLLLIRLGF